MELVTFAAFSKTLAVSSRVLLTTMLGTRARGVPTDCAGPKVEASENSPRCWEKASPRSGLEYDLRLSDIQKGTWV